MANVYVDSNAAGAGTGADWANAYTTLAAALAAKAAGDDFWVAHNHSETTASTIALTSPGTISTPCRIFCVSSAGTVPPVAADLRTTAAIASTGASAITYQGYAYAYGLNITSGNLTNAANQNFGAAAAMRWVMDACNLILGNTSTSSAFAIGSTGAVAYSVVFNNTTLRFGNVSQSITMNGGSLLWKNTASAIVAAGSIPTSLLTGAAGRSATAFLEGVDLSAAGSGKTLAAAFTGGGTVHLKDCQLGASVTIAATPTNAHQRVYVTRCSDTTGNYIEQVYAYEGTQTDETTIVRTGGASDGVTSKSRKLVTTANSKWAHPFDAGPIAIWNDTVNSSVTVTVYGVWGGGAVPNNDDIWMDVEYLGSATAPLGSFATSGKASALATNAALSSDSSTWGGSTTKFKMTATFTPRMKGYIYVYVRAAAASSTLYIDPLPVLS